MNTPIARSLVMVSVYRYASASRQTNAEMAPVVPTTGRCPTCIVCMPMTKVCASTPQASTSVAKRPADSLRLAK